MANRKKRARKLAIAVSLSGLLVWTGGCATGQTISLSALASIGGQQTENQTDNEMDKQSISEDGRGVEHASGIDSGVSGGKEQSSKSDESHGTGVNSPTTESNGATTVVSKGGSIGTADKGNTDNESKDKDSEIKGDASNIKGDNSGANEEDADNSSDSETSNDKQSNEKPPVNTTDKQDDEKAQSTNPGSSTETSANSGKESDQPSTNADDKKEQKLIALTFDDGPDLHYTTAILDILKEKEVHATFFEVGQQIEKYPKVLKRIQEEGHAIGNHTQDHKDLSKLTEAQIIDQMKQVDDEMKDAIGEVPALFRAPYGAVSDTLKKVMEDNGRRLVGWNIDTRDWAGTSIKAMREMIRTKAKPNAIILMHSFGSKNIQHTVDMLADVIDDLQKLGYTLVTVDQIPEK